MPYRSAERGRDLEHVTFFLRSVEQADGSWLCKRGREALATFATLEAALAHLRAVADEIGGDVEIRVHRIGAN